MVITRNINGIEMSLELTPAELTKAYYEQETAFFKSDIGEAIDNINEELDESKKINADEVLNDANLVKSIITAYNDSVTDTEQIEIAVRRYCA